MTDPEAFIKKAKLIVTGTFNDEFPLNGIKRPATPEDFYIVWFAKVLGNWKALVSTDLVNGHYFEVTYNGAKQETYVDHYIKTDNRAFSDTLYEKSVSQDRIERAEFRADAHKAAVFAVKRLKEAGFGNAGIAEQLGISESVVRCLLVP